MTATPKHIHKQVIFKSTASHGTWKKHQAITSVLYKFFQWSITEATLDSPNSCLYAK